MISGKIEMQTHSSSSTASKKQSMPVVSSSSQNRDRRNRGTEPKKKLKKLGSMKLLKLPSLKASNRHAKSRSDWHPTDLYSDAGTSQKPAPIEMTDASPNYVNCSDARKKNFQGGNESEEISVSQYIEESTVIRRSSPQNQDGRTRGNEPKKKLKKSRSIKRATSKSLRPSTRRAISQLDHLSTVLTGDAASPQKHSLLKMPDASPNYLKATSRFDKRKVSFHASPRNCPRNSKSSFDDNDRKRKANILKLNTASSGQKALRTLTRKASLKPLRTLTKMASLKSKKPSMKKCSEVSQFPDLSVHRATCSSTLKDSKFADFVELHPGGNESDKISVMKVCPYTHCSLNGHHHAPLPPLKRFLSTKRRLLKTQKSLKLRGLSPLRTKYSRDKEKETQTSQMVLCDKISSEPDVTAGKCDKEVPVEGKVLQEVHEEINSGMNSNFGEGDFEFNYGNFKIDKTTGVTSEPSNIRSLMPDDSVSSTAINGVVSSAAVPYQLEKLTAASEEENVDFGPDYELIQKLPPHSELTGTSHAENKIMLDKQNYSRMWHLLYQNVISRIAAEVKTRPVNNGTDEKQVDDAGSHQDFFQTDWDMGMENLDEGCPSCETNQIDAIELVQEAVDAIFPPEIQDQPSDGQSIATDIILDQELSEDNHGGGGELGISTSRNFAEDCYEQFNEVEEETGMPLNAEQTWPKADNITAANKEEAVSKVGNKSEQQFAKRWSNLRKLILVKRFIKELAKVRKFIPHDPQYLPLRPGTEPEKFFLRHQIMDERKNAEEWLLDYALRQVVTKLSPARKRKVELLVEAFETFIPLPEVKAHLRNKAVASTQKSMKLTSPTPLGAKHSGDTNRKLETSQMAFNGGPTIQKTANCSTAISSAVNELSRDFSIEGNVKARAHLNGNGIHGGGDEAINDFSDGDKIAKTDYDGKLARILSGKISCPEISLNENLDQSSNFLVVEQNPTCGSSEKLSAACKDTNEYSEPDNGFLKGDPLLGDTESDCSSNAVNRILLDKQKCIRMWRLLYQNAVSHITEEVGTQLPRDRVDEEKQEDGANKFHGIVSGSCQDLFETGQDMGMDNHDAGCQNSKLNQIDAIKLVKEAVDAIFPLETQEHSSDVQSITSDTISDHNLSEKNHEEGAVLSILTSTIFAEGSDRDYDKIKEQSGIILDSEEKRLKADNANIPEGDKTISEVGNKYAQQLPKKSWSKLKRLILLKRFIKEINKVREFNPRGPQYLPIEPDSEAEKVDLRHQIMDERRSAEEWMLDYALQQVVAQLTPERKRRVALLVEAFETVNPLPEIKPHPGHNSVGSAHAKPI